jgi:hypothetical protein
MGLDTKTYWLADGQSQCDFDLFELVEFWDPSLPEYDLGSRGIELNRVFGVGSWQNKGKKGIRRCNGDFMCDFKLQGDCYKSVARKRLAEGVIDWEP